MLCRYAVKSSQVCLSFDNALHMHTPGDRTGGLIVGWPGLDNDLSKRLFRHALQKSCGAIIGDSSAGAEPMCAGLIDSGWGDLSCGLRPGEASERTLLSDSSEDHHQKCVATSPSSDCSKMPSTTLTFDAMSVASR